MTITITNVPEPSIELNVSGDLVFDDTALGWISDKSFIITNNGDGALVEVTDITVTEPFSIESATSFMLEKGNQLEVKVRFSAPNTIPQIFNRELTITFNAGDVTLNVQGRASIITSADNEPIGAKEILVYPNPGVDQIIVDLSVFGAYKPELHFISPEGKELEYYKDIKQDKVAINTSKYPSGIYLIQLINSEGVLTKKVIIKK